MMIAKPLRHTLLLMLLFPLLLFSQQPNTVTIFGTVSDRASGAGLAGVRVEVISEADSSDRASAISDSSGAYRVTLSLSAARAGEAPQDFELMQNYPNPFNPATLIQFQIAQASPVRLDIYNILGQKVRSLLNEPLPAGRYTAVWDGRSDAGTGLAAGIYFYRLQAGDYASARKMILMDGGAAAVPGGAAPLRSGFERDAFSQGDDIQVSIRFTSPFIKPLEEKHVKVPAASFRYDMSAEVLQEVLNRNLIILSEPGDNGLVYISGLAGAMLPGMNGAVNAVAVNQRTGGKDTTSVNPDGSIPVMKLMAAIGDRLTLTLYREENIAGIPEEFVVPETLGPFVIDSKPTNGDKDIVLDVVITITFSEPVDPATVDANSFYLADSLGNRVSGIIEFNGDFTIATLDPANPLAYDTEYAITVTTAVTDLQGLPLEGGYTATFTTIPVILNGSYIHVPADHPSIQAGINAATDGDTVLVADGTYLENINYKGKAIVVASHYLIDGDTAHISATIIDGSQPSNPDSGSVVTFESDEDTTSVLAGFTITGGSGTKTWYQWKGNTFLARVGGGVYCYLSGGRISHNYIRDNHIPYYFESNGGGVCASPVSNYTPYVIVESNRITNNSITGNSCYGSAVNLPNGRIVNNVISNNISTGWATTGYAYGAVVCVADGDLSQTVLIQKNRITHNTVSGNRVIGAGIELEWKINASLIANVIENNTVVSATTSSTGGGIAVYQVLGNVLVDANTIIGNVPETDNLDGGGIALTVPNISSIRVANNLIADNAARVGGGILCRQSRAEIINNTIVNNTASISGGGIGVEGTSVPNIMNTIVWGNSAPSGPQITGTANVSYSNVESGWSGEGNIDAAPLLEADSLSNASPCIGAGTLQYDFGGGVVLQSPAFDISGRMRPNPEGSNPDIGAWESRLALPVPEGLATEPDHAIPASYDLRKNYLNSFNPSVKIKPSKPKTGKED